MTKRTITISNPAKLSLKLRQLKIERRHSEGKQGEVFTLPIEDIGMLILEHPQISLTLPLLQACLAHNVAVVICDATHLPTGMLAPLSSHHLKGERTRLQVEASKPLLKNLWKLLVTQKIINQSHILKYRSPENAKALTTLSKEVKSGDTTNREGAAARIYWSTLFGTGFIRVREGPFPNDLLNYGYTILRAATARAIVGSGLDPTFGIFHRNRYNAYPLADDIMEPYRPFVDSIVVSLVANGSQKLDTHAKHQLLQVLAYEVAIGKVTRPLQIALSTTTSSLADSYGKEGQAKDLQLPSFIT